MEERTTGFYDRVVAAVFNHLVMWVMGLVLSTIAAVLFIREPTLRDWRFASRPSQRASSELVVVYLGEDFRDSVRPGDLTPRTYLADLLGTIAQHQPRVIALDYEIRAQDSLYAVFKEAVLAAGNVVLPTLLNHDSAQTVVMSLWKVPDAETSDLMIAFYQHLHEGSGKTEALRGAVLGRIALLRERHGFAHPYLWGAFISAGNPL